MQRHGGYPGSSSIRTVRPSSWAVVNFSSGLSSVKGSDVGSNAERQVGQQPNTEYNAGCLAVPTLFSVRAAVLYCTTEGASYAIRSARRSAPYRIVL